MATDTPVEVRWDSRNPQNLNYAKPTGFRLSVLNLPQVAFFCQSVTLPGLALGVATVPTPLSDIPLPGEKLTFSDLTIKFIIQSNFEDYIELYNWFIGIGSPTNNSEYTQWINDHDWRFPFPNVKNSKTSGGEFSDGVLTVLTANNNPTIQFHFHNMFPTSLTAISFDISEGRTEFLTCNATFKYHYFVPVPLNTST